jgi:hypothetical protein
MSRATDPARSAEVRETFYVIFRQATATRHVTRAAVENALRQLGRIKTTARCTKEKQMPSKLAVALADVLVKDLHPEAPPSMRDARNASRNRTAMVIDERLAEIRKHYEPEELARCPVVTHHGPSPCAFCICAAMREFILVPERE